MSSDQKLVFKLIITISYNIDSHPIFIIPIDRKQLVVRSE